MNIEACRDVMNIETCRDVMNILSIAKKGAWKIIFEQLLVQGVATVRVRHTCSATIIKANGSSPLGAVFVLAHVTQPAPWHRIDRHSAHAGVTV
jgi:hypothetical protein